MVFSFKTEASPSSTTDEQLPSTTSTNSSSSTTTPVVEIYSQANDEDGENSQRLPLLAPTTSSSQILSYHNITSEINSSLELPLWSLSLDLSTSSSQKNGDGDGLSDELMKSVIVPNLKGSSSSCPPCFIVNVDLDCQNLGSVCPTVRNAVNVIVKNMMKGTDVDDSDVVEEFDPDRLVSLKDGYTSVSSLKSNEFGNCAASGSLALNGTKNKTSNEDYVAFMLAVHPPTKPRSSYQEEQALALVMYHLYKFTLHVNGMLCFVSKENPVTTSTPEASSSSAVASMSVEDFRGIVDQLVSGSVDSPRALAATSKAENIVPEDQNTETKVEADSPDVHQSDVQASLSFICPGTIDSSLIENTMLKNASCDGQWNAAVDSLDVAISPPLNGEMATTSNESASNSKYSSGYNDDEWLSKLASSMKTIETPIKSSSATGKDESSSTKASKAGKSKSSDAKKDEAVSSFFENLLKK